MPTYEFTCKNCGYHFDVFTPISRKKETTCPKCSNTDLQEAFGTFFVGGNVNNPSAGTGTGCNSSSCTSCGSSCKS